MAAAAAATGCYKCGRVGHWSKDCPVQGGAGAGAGAAGESAGAAHKTGGSGSGSGSKGVCFKCGQNGHWATVCPSQTRLAKDGARVQPSSTVAPSEDVRPATRKRPKLTPSLLLSDDGLGYVLEKLPQMVSTRGSEVKMLKSLLEAYMHWHSRLLPYFGYDQFVEKVEKIAGNKRVRTCIQQLREKVGAGKEFGAEREKDTVIAEEAAGCEGPPGDLNIGDGLCDVFDLCADDNEITNNPEDDLLEEYFREAVGEAVPSTPANPRLLEDDRVQLVTSSIKEEQKIRMEANRIKAMERALARCTPLSS